MKFFLSILLITLSWATSFSQNGATLSGIILDEATNKPISFASVSVMSREGILISGGISSEKGRFVLQGLPRGELSVHVSFIGYKNYDTEILVGELNQNYDLGRIFLITQINQLKDLTVAGEQTGTASGLDKKIFQMDDNLSQAGGSILDAMKAMPGISVDQEGKVMLRGSDKVVVLMDGKQSSLTGFGNQKGLDNIPSANVEKIEIINNPSAKYDAAGMAGIINIIYKKEKQQGLTGSASISYGLGAISKAKADLPTELGSFSPTPKYIPGLDLNYNNNKFNVYLQSEVLFQEKLPNNEFTTRFYDDGRITSSQVPENRKQSHYIIKGGIDYAIDDRNKISFSGIYDWEHHIDSAQVPYINMLTNKRYRYISWNEEEITGYMNYALNYEHRFPQAGHKLQANLQYTKGWEDETYYINDSSSVRTGGRDVTAILATEHTSLASVDYTRPLRSGRIETGTKMQIRSLPVDYQVDRGENSIVYPGMGSWSQWGESVYGAYLNLVHEKRTYDIEAGIRTEYTQVYYEMDPANMYFNKNDSYNYLEFFPNVRITYKFNARNKLSAFYNRRIDRPGEPELRMFAKSDDHELLKVGNPYLRPQFTQSFELAYKTIWESGSVFLSAYYRSTMSPFMRIYSIDNTNELYEVIIKSYANTGSSTNKGMELVFSQSVSDILKINGSFNFFENNIHAYLGEILFPYKHSFEIEESLDYTLDMKLNTTFNLKNDVHIQLTGVYIAPRNIPQGKELSRSSLDLGIKKLILHKKGELNLSFTDMLNQYGLRQEIEAEGFSVRYENYYETQVIRIGFKYKF